MLITKEAVQSGFPATSPTILGRVGVPELKNYPVLGQWDGESVFLPKRKEVGRLVRWLALHYPDNASAGMELCELKHPGAFQEVRPFHFERESLIFRQGRTLALTCEVEPEKLPEDPPQKVHELVDEARALYPEASLVVLKPFFEVGKARRDGRRPAKLVTGEALRKEATSQRERIIALARRWGPAIRMEHDVRQRVRNFQLVREVRRLESAIKSRIVRLIPNGLVPDEILAVRQIIRELRMAAKLDLSARPAELRPILETHLPRLEDGIERRKTLQRMEGRVRTPSPEMDFEAFIRRSGLGNFANDADIPSLERQIDELMKLRFALQLHFEPVAGLVLPDEAGMVRMIVHWIWMQRQGGRCLDLHWLSGGKDVFTTIA